MSRLRQALTAIPRRVQRMEDDGCDAVALQALGALAGLFLPWTGFSMRPSAILAVLSDIAINDRRRIVECGSGNSTVYIARLLAERGAGSIVTVDHDASWAQLTRRALAREGLSQWATVIHAPLVDGWYDRAALPEIDRIDLLVVDGPPAYRYEQRHARAAALDVFAERLIPDATVILDDARREGERDVIARWTLRHRRAFRLERGGYAISAPYLT